MGIMDIDEEIKNAIELEIRRLEEEEELQNKQLMEMKEIRDMRLKLLINISPLEIIDNVGDEDFINLVAENVNQIELVIHVIYHYFIYQYWSPRSASTSTNSSSSSSSLSCQHHDYHHPRDDDDEEMILASCRPLLDSPQRIKIYINQGVFEASDDHIMSTLLGDVDVLFEYSMLPTYEHLKDVKRRITRSMAEAKAHVLRAKPKRVRICVDVSEVVKNYYGSREAATFVAAMEAATEASSLACDDDHDTLYLPRPTNAYNIKRASRLSKEALQVKTFEKEDLIFIGNSNSNSNSREKVDEQYSSSYSCPICLKELCIGVDIVQKMPCSHVFHCACLGDWLRERNTCPLCRFELPSWNGLQRPITRTPSNSVVRGFNSH